MYGLLFRAVLSRSGKLPVLVLIVLMVAGFALILFAVQFNKAGGKSRPQFQKGMTYATWNKDAWTVGAFTQYISSLYDDSITNSAGDYWTVDSTLTANLYAEYEFGADRFGGMLSDTAVRVGVRNITEPAVLELVASLVERRLVEAPSGLGGQRIEFPGLQATIADVLVRVHALDGNTSTTLVRGSKWKSHTPSSSMVRVTTWPSRRIRNSSSRNSRGCSSMRCPARVTTRRIRSISRSPTRSTVTSC